MDSGAIVNAINTILSEKKIEKETLNEIIESIFTTLLKKKYNIETDDEFEKYFTVTSNMDNGDIEIIHERVVVNDSEFKDELSEIRFTDAVKIDSDTAVGEDLPEIIDLQSFGRRNVITAKQILAQKIKKVEKINLFNVFKKRIGEILTCNIHQIAQRELKVHFEDIELILPREECVFNERYRRGELLRVYVKNVIERNQDVKIIVSRTDKNFIKKLFELEVPEISDGIIKIINIGRIPGIRSKIILESLDSRVDPVGACVGQRGARISAIVSELNKEKVDIIQFIDEPKMFITRLLGIKSEYQIDVDEYNKKAEIVIMDALYNDVLGYKNSNLSLAEKLSGYSISVLTESQFDKQNEIRLETVEDIDDEIKKILIANNYETAQEVFDVGQQEFITSEILTKEQTNDVFKVLNKLYDE